MSKHQLQQALVCPQTRQILRLINEQQMIQLNNQIRVGQVTTKSGKIVHQELKEAYLSQDGKTLYQIQNGIPILLADQSIDIASFAVTH